MQQRKHLKKWPPREPSQKKAMKKKPLKNYPKKGVNQKEATKKLKEK